MEDLRREPRDDDDDGEDLAEVRRRVRESLPDIHHPNSIRAHDAQEFVGEPEYEVFRTWPDGTRVRIERTDWRWLTDALDVIGWWAATAERPEHHREPWGITHAPLVMRRGITAIYIKDRGRGGEMFQVHDADIDVDGGTIIVPVGKITGRPMTLISKEELMHMLGVTSRTTVDDLARRYPGRFPKKIKLNRSFVRYRLDEAEAFVGWLAEQGDQTAGQGP